MELAELPDVQHMSQTSSQNRLLSITRPSRPPHQPRCNPPYPLVPLFSCPRCLSQCLYWHSHWALPYSVVSGNAFLGTRKSSSVELPDGLYTSSNQTRQTTKKLILRFCTLHRMSSEHWSLSHERLWLKPTRSRRTTLLLEPPPCHLEPTPTLPHRSTPRLQPETVYFCVLCMHSTYHTVTHVILHF